MSSPIKIKTKLIPAEARSKDLKNTGVVGHYSSGGSTTSTGAPVQESIEIVASGEDRQLKDNNVLSSLRTIKEILARIISNTEEATDENTYSAAKINSMVEAIDEAIEEVQDSVSDLDDKYLSKDKADATEHLINFLAGLKISDKAHIDSDGNAKLQRLIVEGSMVLQELIYNRVTAVESDQWHTAAHTIESVKEIEANTLQITFTKRWDNDFIAFREGDILMGSANELDEKGVYYTSFVRVVSVNVNTNSVVAVLYPDNEVPGAKNYAPTKPMLLVHRGSVTDVDRQRVWYTSSREGREVLLSGVDKPILEYYNYAYFNGLPIALPQFEGLPINYKDSAVYARTLFYQDAYRIDYEGKPVPTPVDLGIWDKDATYTNGMDSLEQSDVWHNGIKWRCIVPSTKSEPSIFSTDWVALTGDTELRMELLSERGFIYLDTDVNDLVTSVVRLGQLDVTSKVLPSDWSWTRNTGNADLDALWNEQHKGLTNKLELKQSDVQDAEGIISITCTAYYRTESRVMKIENSINL